MQKHKSEAIRYFENAKELLNKSPIENNRYTDIKYVQEACGTAYLAILKAIDEYLIEHGVNPKELPHSVDGYREKIKKYLSIHNGKLNKEFEKLYEELHIAGYYRGNLSNTDAIKAILKSAKAFIDKII
jgi:hypothetical protein